MVMVAMAPEEKEKERALSMSGINRFLSRREKRSSGSHEKKPRLISSEIYGLFNADDKKKLEKSEEKKVKALSKRLAPLGLSSLLETHVKPSLRSRDTVEGAVKNYDLLMLYEDSLEGVLYKYDPSYQLLGAVNRHAVTCYLDALLFAMFARLPTFEAILYKSFDDLPRQRLAALLRVWVNMLRRGKLITTDITEQIQLALAECGWKEAANVRQQDASEAFTFIAETLDLPHLTLKMDIFHTGKEDATDDHKLINERLLEVAIPENPADGKPITLEDCLETYFNNKIEVKRMMEHRRTISGQVKGESMHIDTSNLGADPSGSDALVPSPVPMSPIVWSPSRTRDRAHSLIRDRVVPSAEEGEPSNAAGQTSHQRSNSMKKKEVMMPAWQFFSLIPWYTEGRPTSNAQVAAHFAKQRPVLGLCLKRYTMSPSGQAIRLNTHIDIPLDIGLPHFIQDENCEDSGRLFGNFKLVLQSAVCHRGLSVDSGHYVTLLRGPRIAPASDADVEVNGSVPVYREPEADTWLLFDDLAPERVITVDIKQALCKESPYLLFYQVQPIEGSHLTSDRFEEAPPAYSERPTTTKDPTHTPSYAESRSDPEEPAGLSAASRSGSQVTDEVQPRGSVSSDWRRSIVFTDGAESLRPEQVRSRPMTPSESTHASRTSSKRSSRVEVTGEGSKSRQLSQAGEGRLSATFSRFADRMGRDSKTKDGAAIATAEASEVDEAGLDETARRPKKGKRAKSRTRMKFTSTDSPTDEKEKTGDRECNVM